MRTRAALLGLLALAGCGGSSAKTATSTPDTTTSTARTSFSTTGPTLAKGFVLSSPAFKNNGAIPRRYTCDGAGTPIPLKWSGVPRSAQELVLVMRDPDAPGAPFVHWALAGISPSTSTVPANPIEGRDSAGRSGYTPPCPPSGDRPHHYVITLTALSGPSHLSDGFTPDQLRTGAVGIASLVGVYKRA
jgi:Raf kinase inhibitor-like YbhB/YbcL family protein